MLRLFARIVGGFRSGLAAGLPIGSLTSQHLANFYLGYFDRFVKERLRVRGYVRYMDDMILWGPTPELLREQLSRSRDFLHDELGLELNAAVADGASRSGIEFLGCRVFPARLELNRASKVRLRLKLRRLEEAFLANAITESELQQRATALCAFTTAAGVRSWRFRTAVIQRLPVSGPEASTA